MPKDDSSDLKREKSEEERSRSLRRFSGIKTQAILIDTSTRKWFESSPERTRQVLELRYKEFSDLDTDLLENRILSSAPIEWQKRPDYWRALVEELRSRS